MKASRIVAFYAVLAAVAALLFIEHVEESPLPKTASVSEGDRAFFLPIEDFYENQTVRRFGEFFEEPYRGFHTGTDVEVDSARADAPVPVYAMTDGEVAFSQFVKGYGGVVVIDHGEEEIPLYGIYGHLRLSDLSISLGDRVRGGARVGFLGDAFSVETDGERKHLHFGLYTKSPYELVGYVDDTDALSRWQDPTEFLKERDARSVH
jgi:murein DD-endopeptidase MepM/ murein hydrolase activator NlpD